MTTRVRDSKVRRVFGTQAPSQDHYNGVKFQPLGAEANPLKANGTRFAFPWRARGTVALWDLKSVGAIPEDMPMLEADDEVSDFEFNPFDDNMIAVSYQSNVKIWQVPTEGLHQGIQPTSDLENLHEKRLLNLYWHPLASNILLTVAADKMVKFWDIDAGGGEKLTLDESQHDQSVASISWNYHATQMITTSKDKHLRLFDPRSGSLIAKTICHEGAKASRCLWLGNSDQILTVGFKKGQPDREMIVFDSRNLNSKIAQFTLDNSPSSMFPYFDPDLNLVYLVGKGDGNIRIFELTKDALPLQESGEFRSPNAQAGFAYLPKSFCDVMKCEVARFLKLQANSVVPIRFEITRQNSGYIFQQDLYPDTWDGKPAYEASEWFGGADKAPTLAKVTENGIQA